MDEQLREKNNKRCVHSACAFNGNTHGVQKHSHSCVRPLYSQRNNRLVSTLRHFCGCHHYEKACQLDWQREARHFSSPKQTDTVAGSRKQPQLLPDRLDARRATRLCCHTHTHTTLINQSALYLLPPPDPTGSHCLPVTASPDMTHACQTQTACPASADEPAQEFQVFLLSWKPPTTI